MSGDADAGASRTAQVPNLRDLLVGSRWFRRHQPFPHVVATDVLRPDLYGKLEAELDRRLAAGPVSTVTAGRFAPLTGYGALACPITDRADDPFSLFVSRGWHDLIAGVVGVEATGDMRASLHHHRVGSPSGAVHNDLNVGHFPGRPSSRAVILEDADQCRYHDGRPTRAGITVRRVVRAATFLYYIGNGPWRVGDGGETALYRDGCGRSDRPSASVAPLDNSLVAFACTPRSFHAFRTNLCRPRNCLVAWLHCEPEEVALRWGDSAVVPWPATP